jgi:hypothetical protein
VLVGARLSGRKLAVIGPSGGWAGVGEGERFGASRCVAGAGPVTSTGALFSEHVHADNQTTPNERHLMGGPVAPGRTDVKNLEQISSAPLMEVDARSEAVWPVWLVFERGGMGSPL